MQIQQESVNPTGYVLIPTGVWPEVYWIPHTKSGDKSEYSLSGKGTGSDSE
jgi:hypothetical protein